MATLKEVKTKISGVKKTKQITRAMNMVAASRLRGMQRKMQAFRPYAFKFKEVLASLAERAGFASPLLVAKEREDVRKVHLIVCTSDRGLCGGFNISVLDKAERWIKEWGPEVEVSITAFGKKAQDWTRKTGRHLEDSYLGIMGMSFGFGIASRAGDKLLKQFLAGTYDEVHIIFSEFQGMSRQVPTFQQLLPVPHIIEEETEDTGEKKYLPEHLCEPSPTVLLNEMLPKDVHIQLYRALLETSTSEHAARMVAMDNATRACNDIIKDLNRLFNKARQAAITNDLIDIVSGAEALKG